MVDEVGALAAAIIRRQADRERKVLAYIQSLIDEARRTNENQAMFLDDFPDYPMLSAVLHGNGHEDGRVVVEGELNPMNEISLDEDTLHIYGLPEAWMTKAIAASEAELSLSSILDGCGTFDPKLGGYETVEFGGRKDVIRITLSRTTMPLADLFAEIRDTLARAVMPLDSHLKEARS